MKKIKTLVVKLTNINVLTKLAVFGVFLAVAILAPAIKQQFVTGPVVNATLFLSVLFLGFRASLLIGLLPSLFALQIGLLSPVMLPIVPFIMTGNIILVFTFWILKKKFWSGVLLGSVLKFLFLFLSSSIVVKFFIPEKIATNLTFMMSWPQLVTALAGGIITFFVLKMFSYEEK